MPEIDVLPVVAAAIVVFVLGSAYYAVFAAQWSRVSDRGAAGDRPAPWQMAVEFSRGLIHAGDWLIKLLVVGVIVSAWQ